MRLLLSRLLTYTCEILSDIPWEHWGVISVLSLTLTVFLFLRQRHSAYSTICLGLTVFLVLLLLDTAVVLRWGDGINHSLGISLPLEFNRLIHGGLVRWTEMLANVAVFVPFGFFLSEFLSTTKRFAPRRQLRIVVLSAFGLSMCIECLQLFLHLGVCELTDLVLNTLGGVVGALMSAGMRKVVGERRYGL